MKWKCDQCGKEDEFENMVDREVLMFCKECYYKSQMELI